MGYSIAVGETSLALNQANFTLKGVAAVYKGSEITLGIANNGELIDASTGEHIEHDDLRVRSGTTIRLRGLQKAGAWNGRIAVVGEFNESNHRYKLDMGNKCQLSCKAN